MRYFSMFSGIGGFELGIEKAIQCLAEQSRGWNSISPIRDSSDNEGESRKDYTCIGYSEVDKYAIQIYQNHFKGHKNYGDCTKINYNEIPDFELLCGGFPCQSFSIAGKRAGFNDTRGTLFFEIARCLKEKQPRLFLLENVKGLLSHNKGATFLTILTTLDELGYDCQWQVLNSKNFGVPQNRERVFIIGYLRGFRRPEVFPIGESSQQITTIQSPEQSKGERLQSKNADEERLWSSIESGGARVRRLTPTECERLQGFPDGWTEGISDTQRYKCLGNAVTVNVIEAIITNLSRGEG